MDAPKSCVSRSLARLETRIGAALFERSGRIFRLTDAGALLLPHARSIATAVDAAENVLSDLHGTPNGLLRVKATYSLAQAVIAPMLPNFWKRYPNVKVRLNDGNRRADLLADDADLVIGIAPPGKSPAEARVLATIELWTCASPTYLSRRGTPKVVSDLSVHDLLGVRDPMRWSYTTPEDHRQAFDFVPHAVVSEPATAETIIVGGGAIGRLPDYLAKAAVARGRLVRVLGDLTSDRIEVQAIAPRGHSFSARACVFMEALEGQLASMS